jgi:hypothetical protein
MVGIIQGDNVSSWDVTYKEQIGFPKTSAK